MTAATISIFIITFIALIVGAIIGVLAFKFSKVNRETFEATQSIIGNPDQIANAMELTPKKIFPKPYLNMPQTVPASFDQGYVDAAQNNNYDVSGYKFTEQSQTSSQQLDDSKLTDEQIRDKYKNMYMLDQTGELAKYDLSRNITSKYCCPASYRSASGGDDDFDPKTALEYSNKYVANGYSAYTFNSGAGCLCVTPEQAHFFATRGGNTTV